MIRPQRILCRPQKARGRGATGRVAKVRTSRRLTRWVRASRQSPRPNRGRAPRWAVLACAAASSRGEGELTKSLDDESGIRSSNLFGPAIEGTGREAPHILKGSPSAYATFACTLSQNLASLSASRSVAGL